MTERTGYIARVRELARLVAVNFLEQREEAGYPFKQKGGLKSVEKKTLLLEILTEEIPSRFVPALRQLEENGARILQENRLGYEKIISFGTPRRLVFLASGVDQRQKPAVERKKGPSCQAAFNSDGSPNKAALGFARGQGLQVEDLVVEKVGEVPYLFAVKEIPGEYALDILPSLMKTYFVPEFSQKYTGPPKG